MDLFKYKNSSYLNKQPLSTRLRPENVLSVLGQEHLLGKNQLLNQLIETDEIPSAIFWGPPGCGKTTVATIIGEKTKSNFFNLSATSTSTSILRETFDKAKENKDLYSTQTIIFIDELHRYSKTQQTLFLPYIEEGIITFIGATTENPSVVIIPPLLSRCHVFEFKALSLTILENIIEKAFNVIPEKDHLQLSPEGITKIAELSYGDARTAINLLESISLIGLKKSKSTNTVISITESFATQMSSSITSRHYRKGDEHYNTISAFIKSMRASDPDASIYWLHRMIAGGEDPMYIARRMVIFASEDIGLKDNHALPIAMSALETVKNIGLPEATYALSHVTIYLSLAKKSRSITNAMNNASSFVKNTQHLPPPLHLINIHPEKTNDHNKTSNSNFPNQTGDKKLFFPEDEQP